MVGGVPELRHAIDQFAWGRGALQFAEMDLKQHQVLADRLGPLPAGELLLLAVARKCGQDKHLWQRARDLGIPWQHKHWSGLSKLEKTFNHGVTRLDAVVEDAVSPPAPTKHAVLSDSSPRQARFPQPERSSEKELGSVDRERSPMVHRLVEREEPEARSQNRAHMAFANTLKHHFDKETFDRHRLMVESADVRCRFSGRPKYDVRLKKPNDLDLDWVYSVPCAETPALSQCESWIFLHVPNNQEKWGPDKKSWINEYLHSLNWCQVRNNGNKRFICPKCTASGL